MKWITRAALVPLIVTCAAQIAWAGGRSNGGGTVHVRGSYRSNGTYVHAYDRAAPHTSSYSVTRASRASTYVPTTSSAPKFSASQSALSIQPRTPAPYRATYTGIPHTEYSSSLGVQRDAHGRIKRSESAKREFMRQSRHPNGWSSHVVDHVIPLKRGGADDPSNMQWQTIQEAKAKDKWE